MMTIPTRSNRPTFVWMLRSSTAAVSTVAVKLSGARSGLGQDDDDIPLSLFLIWFFSTRNIHCIASGTPQVYLGVFMVSHPNKYIWRKLHWSLFYKDTTRRLGTLSNLNHSFLEQREDFGKDGKRSGFLNTWITFSGNV